ncbi:MAG TPA: amino acid adenylation domain-containing protein [Pseudonocardiaceae bacterium]
MAGLLAAAGVGRGDVVGVCVPRDLDLPAILTGVWRAGAAFLPLDPEQPVARRRQLVGTAAAAVVLTTADRLAELREAVGDGDGGPGCAVLDVAAPAEPLAAPVAVGADDAAYVMLTSGSTGRPKGVLITHGGIANRVCWTVREQGLTAEDRVLAKTRFGFDAAVLEWFAPLVAGAAVVVAAPGVERDPAALVRAVGDAGATVLQLVPSVLRAMLDEPGWSRLTALRQVWLAGEPLDHALLGRLRDKVSGVTVWNTYGPTECSIDVTAFRVDPASSGTGPVPIGRPLTATRVLVLDREGQVVPIGVPGELYVGGAGLARGYLGEAGLTAERFVPDPTAEGGRLYRTGDLVRWVAPGGSDAEAVLEFLGRADDQVKINGVRIEPAEVQAVIAGHPDVRQAFVTGHTGPDGTKRLVAYVVADEQVDGPRIRRFLAGQLPEAMIPSTYVQLEALPRDVNGKVDRRALPAPDAVSAAADFQAPGTPAEQLVAQVWAELLDADVTRIGVRDDFFALGGHSLMLGRLAVRLRERSGVTVSIRDLYGGLTVAEQGALLDAGLFDADPAAAGPPVVPVPRDRPLPLSFGQRRLWFVDQLSGGTTEYLSPLFLRLPAGTDPERVRAALTRVVARHEVLRTRYVVADGEPWQVVDEPAPAALDVLDVPAAGLAGALAAHFGRRFDLAAGPVWRAALARPDDGGDAVLMMTMHHIGTDGLSTAILEGELAALVADPGAALPEPPVQYAAFAVWQREHQAGEAGAAQLAYWRERLAGLPVLELPTDRPRPMVRDPRGGLVTVPVARETADAVIAAGRNRGATPFMTLLAVYAVLLGRYSGQRDLAIGTPVAGRVRPELDGVVGAFLNTLVLRCDLSGDPEFGELLHRLRASGLEAYAHQDLPFERLVEELRGDTDRGHLPLVQAFCNLPVQGAPVTAGDEAPMPVAPGGSLFDLTLHLVPRGGDLESDDAELELQFGYPDELFDAATVEGMARHFVTLLESVAADPDAPLSRLRMLTGDEHEELLAAGTGRSSGSAATLPDLGARRAAATPDAVAVASAGRRQTYAQLRAHADRVTGQLVDAGVRRGDVVGVCVPRGLELVAVLLGVWRSGAAFLPLDPEQPPARWGRLLTAAGARAVLTDATRVDALREAAPPACAVLDLDAAPTTSGLANGPQVALHPDDAAYVMFTSGSTGRPKGVVITHGGIANRVRWTVTEQGMGTRDRVLAKTRFGFDAAVLEWFAPLVAGGTVVVAPPGAERDPAALVALTAETRTTMLQLVPSVLRAMLDEPGWSGLTALRQLWLAGEPLDFALLRRLRDKLPGVTVWNTYGPTECSIDVTAFPVTPEVTGTGPVPIGGPLHDTRVLVLDRAGRPVPVGVAGELCVGGAGLARGYLGEPAMTAERFVPDPTGTGTRLYRTGDLVRWRRSADGPRLEFVGRADDQLKINGVRVEPAEVQAAIAEHPKVRQVFVTGHAPADGPKRLVAYLVSDDPEPATLAERMRRFLSARLPEAMIPSVFVPLGSLPRDANGKVDRAALPAPETVDRAAGFRPAETEAERLVTAVWAELLEIEDPATIGVHDDFFALGGHSMMLGRLAARLGERSGTPVAVRDLFAGITVAAQAALLEAPAARPAAPPVTRAERAPRMPLSFGQRRLWFLDQLRPGSAEYLTPLFARVPAGTDPERVREALTALVARHEALRTHYELADGEPWQVVAEPAPAELRVVDAPDDVAAVIGEELSTGFDLATGPVWRALLVRPAGEDAVLVLNLHHIASDGWSNALLEREFHALLAGRGDELAEPAVQYADYAAWQHEWLTDELVERQLGYWRERLDGAPMLELPTDRARPPLRDAAGGMVAFTVPPELAGRVLAAGRRRGASPFVTLLAVYAALLSRHSGQHDFTIGTPVAGRVRPELDGVVGVFINTLVLRCDLTGDPEFGELLHRLRGTALGALDNQDLPFERLVDELQSERDLSRTALYGALFDLHEDEHTGHLPGERLGEAALTVRQDLGLVVRRQADGSLLGMIEYASALFDRATIERMAGHYTRLLEAVAGDPDVRLSRMELLGEAERRQLLVEWNDTATERPAGLFLDAFARSVAANPDAPAAISAEERCTYAELDARANRLAHRLIALGAGPDRVVGICLDRGVELIVAMLGVLKAGAAYVPLDPEHPRERWRYALADTAAGIVVTQPRYAEALTELAAIPQVLLTGTPLTGQPDTAPAVRIDPLSLAYVMYTSGSTGRPKGVLISHEGLIHYLWWTVEGYAAFGEGGAPLFSSVAFDMVVPNIYTPLMTGQPVHLLPQEFGIADLGALLVERGPFSFIKLTPGHTELLAHQLTAEQAGGLAAMLAIGADALPGRVADRIRELAGPGTRLLNEYGPTEITVANSTFPITGPSDREVVPIGRPVPNTTMYVVDALLRPLPVGVVGELVIGGVTVARGYNNLPERTAERFVPDPFGTPGTRMYRTGDLARVLPDGNVEFLGRADDQIKIRGYRIEPGEVQTVLADHPSVHEALVLAVDVAPGDKRLVAYVVPVEPAEPPSSDLLAKHCRELLPEPMVPQFFVLIDRIPLNENGKVHRRALPRPDVSGALDAPVPPSTPTEERVAELWAELLGAEPSAIGVHHNFFQLGGHSILAVRLNARIREDFDVALPLRAIFERPTVAQLAEAVEEEIRREIDAMTDDELAGLE